MPHINHRRAKCIRGTTLIHDHYVPFLKEVDRRVGQMARVDLQRNYDFMNAWIDGLTPTEALVDAINAALQ